jgi:HEAT repeat protein
VALEYEIINASDLQSLRAALGDESPYVRSVAARALGILGDRTSADALAGLLEADPEEMVRIRAVESLGLLKAKPEAIELARKDRSLGVQWAAEMAAGQLETDADHAALVRQAYAAGIRREAMGSARVGQPAPDFAALTSDGKPFRLSAVLGRRPIAIYFAAYEG